MKKKRRLGLFPGIVLIVGALIVCGHLLATAAFTGPQTPLKSSLQPALNKYFLGPLDQGWSLFAPGPYSQDEQFLIRACLSSAEVCAGGESAGAEFSDWHNMTAEEQEAILYNIFANRETRQSKAVHGRLWSANSAMNEENQERASANHVDGTPVFGVDLYSDEATEAFPAGELNQMRTYQRLENAAVGLATLRGQELWGEDFSMVEVRLRRDPITPFASRFDDESEPSSQWVNIGWRPAQQFDEEVLAAWR
ncbi:DUF5819 family protein [Citricoccus zhacaiensis]